MEPTPADQSEPPRDALSPPQTARALRHPVVATGGSVQRLGDHAALANGGRGWRFEQMAQPGTERAVVDRAADLQ
jgi:hypothetical protein